MVTEPIAKQSIWLSLVAVRVREASLGEVFGIFGPGCSAHTLRAMSREHGAVLELRTGLEPDLLHVMSVVDSPFVAKVVHQSLTESQLVAPTDRPGDDLVAAIDTLSACAFEYPPGVPAVDEEGGVSFLDMVRSLDVFARVAMVHDWAMGFEALYSALRQSQLLQRRVDAYGVPFRHKLFRLGFRGGLVIVPALATGWDYTGPPIGSDLQRLLLPRTMAGRVADTIERIVAASALPTGFTSFAELPNPGALLAFAQRLGDAFDVDGGRIGLQVAVQSRFAELRETQDRFVSDADSERTTARHSVDERLRVGDLEISANLVTREQFEVFLASTHRSYPAGYPPGRPGRGSATFVSHDDALAYCTWRSARLLTVRELSRCAPALKHRCLWEWTADASPKGGHVVLGGRWRDQAEVPTFANQSWEDRPAHDVGFRCCFR